MWQKIAPGIVKNCCTLPTNLSKGPKYMRSSTTLLFSLCCLALAYPTVLPAQFQAPSKEELEMTSDPKAPGADAVYFYREEKTDDNLHYHGTYVRLKVLTEKGKDMATVHIPYERRSYKVTNIEGRTIHPDGTIIPLTAKPSDLTEVKTKDYQVNTMVFTLPSVEVGSILEYRLQIRYDDNTVSSPNWNVQQPYFIHKAHFQFLPAREGMEITNSRGDLMVNLMYAAIGGIGDKVSHNAANNLYTLDLTDIPAIPSEDWMPPLNSLNWRVEFYYSQYRSGGEFWQKEGNRWAKETDHFANPSKGLKDAISKIVSPTDTDEQKARKIYAEVMKFDNFDFTRQKSNAERKSEKLKTIKEAEDVWTQKGGSSDDIALLYVALARAAGLKVYPMQVVNRNRAIFDANYLSLSQLDDYVVIVELAGKEVFLDPGQKLCPYGELHWKHELASGLRLTEKGPQLGITPPAIYTANVLKRVGILEIDPTGGVKGSIRFVMKGQEALHWRQLTLKNDEEEVKKQFNESISKYMPDGVQADFNHFVSLQDYDTNLLAIIDISGSLATATGKHVFLPELFFESHSSHPFVSQDKRTTPVDVHYPKIEQDEVTYHLPAEFTVETPPAPADVAWQRYAIYKDSTTLKGNEVAIVRTIGYNFTLLQSKDYGDLHDFYQKVAAADQQQLVLTRSPAAKGN